MAYRKRAILIYVVLFVLSCPGMALACGARVNFIMDTKPVQRQQFAGTSSGIAGHLSGNTTIALIPQTGGPVAGCQGLSALDIRVTTNAAIGVSSAYPPGSCQHNVVTAHENKHLQVMNSFMASVPGLYQGKVQAMLSSGVSQGVLQKISSFLMVEINRAHHDMQYQNVDRPDLIHREQAQCGRW